MLAASYGYVGRPWVTWGDTRCLANAARGIYPKLAPGSPIAASGTFRPDQSRPLRLIFMGDMLVGHLTLQCLMAQGEAN